MSIESLIDDAKGESGDEPTDDSDSDEWLSGLAGMVSIKQTHRHLRVAEVCPTCKEEDTEKIHYYWRCNNDDCETVTYLHTDYKLDLSRFW